MSTKETMTDAAYNVLAKRKTEIDFARLWQEVAKKQDIPEERLSRKKAQFLSELMLDGRFASLHGNKWDLKTRRKFNEFHKDLDVDDTDDDEIDESQDEESMGSESASEY